MEQDVDARLAAARARAAERTATKSRCRLVASFTSTARMKQDVAVVRSRLGAQLRDLRRAADEFAAERDRTLGGS